MYIFTGYLAWCTAFKPKCLFGVTKVSLQIFMLQWGMAPKRCSQYYQGVSCSHVSETLQVTQTMCRYFVTKWDLKNPYVLWRDFKTSGFEHILLYYVRMGWNPAPGHNDIMLGFYRGNGGQYVVHVKSPAWLSTNFEIVRNYCNGDAGFWQTQIRTLKNELGMQYN